MKRVLNILAATLLLMTVSVSVASNKISLDLKSSYHETINLNGHTKDVVKDYDMQPNIAINQSLKLQNAIDDISNRGGGVLIIPKGTYYFAGVKIASNVHILVSKDAILKPYFENIQKGGVMFSFSNIDENSSNYVEDCSIRCLDEGEQYTVDYSECNTDVKVRFIICRMVKNFLIADAKIMDNYTTHCGIIFVPTNAKDADMWDVSRPTDGEIRNCSIYNAKTGYGLCQLHGAQTLYFKDIYSNGGVTLRLESGAGGVHAGVFDVSANNVISENGRSAVMMNPHSTVNGTIKIDGVESKGSGIAVLVHGGFVDRKHQHIPGAKPGRYADDSEIVNIKAYYGQVGQVDEKQVFACEPIASEYAKFKFNDYGDVKSFIAPSLLPVLDCTNGNYTVTYKNIRSKGFPKKYNCVVYESEIDDRKQHNSEIISELPVIKSLSPEARDAYFNVKAQKLEAQNAKVEERKAQTKQK